MIWPRLRGRAGGSRAVKHGHGTEPAVWPRPAASWCHHTVYVSGRFLSGMNRRHHRMVSGGGGEGTRLAAAAVVAAALLLQPPSATAVRSFGTGYTGPVCVGNQTKIFNHTVSDASRMGLMSHFWTTGLSEEAQAGQNYQLEISYTFDGEPSPSISFNPAEAMGQMHGAVQLGGDATWLDGTRSATANTSVFAAGDKMGKNAMTSAWYNYYRLPFSSSVRVTASLTARPGQPAPPAGTCGYAYVIVRGHEISSAATAAIELPSGFKLPPTARMELQHTDTLAPLGDYVPLANVSSGRQALLYMVTLGLTASPPFGGKHETNKSKTLGVGHYVGAEKQKPFFAPFYIATESHHHFTVDRLGTHP
jgi:hypothetical protein